MSAVINRPTMYFLDESRIPQPTDDVDAWKRWMADQDRCLLASDVVKSVTLTTRFTGLDMGVNGPELYETIATLPQGAHVTKRYSSEKDALAGHDDAIKTLIASKDLYEATLNWGSK